LIAAKLENAAEVLRHVRVHVASQWDDPMSLRINQQFLDALQPRLRRALDAIRHLQELLQRAEQECT
jgi:hypothetical protein